MCRLHTQKYLYDIHTHTITILSHPSNARQINGLLSLPDRLPFPWPSWPGTSIVQFGCVACCVLSTGGELEDTG